MKTAIIGLPMVGKTSLFTILTGVHQETHVGSTAARVGVATVPDPRLEELARLFEPPKVTHATVEYVDMPPISKENLRDPSYLGSLRLVDAFAHVVRLFADATVPHEKGSVDPLRDLEDVETELILSDLVVVEKRLERLEKDRKKIKSAELDHEFALLEQSKAALEANRPLRRLEIDAEQEKRIRGFQFLSRKPMLYVLNLGESEAGELHAREKEYREGPLAGLEHTAVTAVCGETEVRAWTIPIHSTALKAAGAIHSDFEKKFIRAEVVNWKALVDHLGYPGVREKGLLRLEGKEYIVKDGDVLVIRHG